MYHALVRRQIHRAFNKLGTGDWRPLVEGMADDVHHIFAGDHPLGGERHTRAAVASWFQRLTRLFPGHHFDVHRILSSGWP